MNELDRFWAKVNKTSFCWNWTAYCGNGYGRFNANGKIVSAHRYSWQLVNGPILDGLVLDHLCRNRSCVNPKHLQPVTSRENTLRGETIAAREAAQTHCKRGHLLQGYNLIVWSDGKRRCRTCRGR